MDNSSLVIPPPEPVDLTEERQKEVYNEALMAAAINLRYQARCKSRLKAASDRALAERKMNEPLRAKMPQAAFDDGLFDTGARKQQKLSPDDKEEKTILRKCFPLMIAEINKNKGILPYDDVVLTWGQEAVDLAIEETAVLLINLHKEYKPGDTLAPVAKGIATLSWEQKWPEWLKISYN